MQASDIQLRSVPRHLARIMDGTNRWARREGYAGVAGHRAGAEVAREIVSACEMRGIRYLTLFAFSSENWGRPKAEVRALLALLSRYLRNEVEKLARDGVRLRVIGRRDRFSPHLQKLIARAEAATETGDRATLTLALDYGGRWDVAEVTRSIAKDVAAGKLNPADIDEETVSQRLTTAD
ncbi:MAG: polyprenyl diphosphate synthase, partial [Pseudomonadota bacterium]|nr:polyprenyl diphosphate synthase [Pseudomonadota bacterium]